MSKTLKTATQDWTRLEAMTDAERRAAAMRDLDAKPQTPDELKRMKKTPRAKTIRRALVKSQGY